METERVSPEDAITEALEASRRPLSFTELTHAYRRATGGWATTERMMGVLSRLVVRRRIVRRPVGMDDGAARNFAVELCDFHPAGRDAWVTEAPCPRCGVYIASDEECARCAEDDAAYRERVA